MGLQAGRDCVVILMGYYFNGLLPLAQIQLSLIEIFLTILASWRYFKGSAPCKNRQTKLASQTNLLWDTWPSNSHHDIARPDTATRMTWGGSCSVLPSQPLSLQIFTCLLPSKQIQETQSLKLIMKSEVFGATGRDQSRSVRSVLCWGSTKDCKRNNRAPLTVFFFWMKVHIPLQQLWW